MENKSLDKNNMNEDQIFNKGKHAYIYWKVLFENYPLEK